jgi:hypothetical protein
MAWKLWVERIKGTNKRTSFANNKESPPTLHFLEHSQAFNEERERYKHRNKRRVRWAYQPPASSIFHSEQTSQQQQANTTFLSEKISTSDQTPTKRTGC